jgi:phosphoenolpyruvate carboxylase
VLLPGWFGFGSGIERFLASAGTAAGRRTRRQLLRRMLADWPFFRALASNMEMVLAKTDLTIAGRYARLATDRRRGAAIFGAIEREWQLTVRHWLAISGQRRLLESNAELAQRIRQRLPYVDPLNHLQVELLERYRRGRTDDRSKRGIHLTINGISAGLRNTG